MNWAERSFLAAVLLVAGGAILVALNALGVKIPLLSDAAPPGTALTDDDAYDMPPDLTDVDGLLAELQIEPPDEEAGPAIPALAVVPRNVPLADGSARDAPGGHLATVTGAGEGKAAARDPLVDELKAKTDLADPGQLLAFLVATFTPRGTKLGEEDIEFLMEALGAQEDWGVRNLLFSHLERIGGEAVTEGVLEFLATEKHPASLERALQTLRTLNDDAAVAGIVDFLSTAPSKRLRESALENLLATKNGSAAEPLLRLLGEARDPAMKKYALAALSQLGGAGGAQAILDYARSSDPFERAIGQKSLRDIRGQEAVPLLSEALTREPDVGIRAQVLRTLGTIRDPRAIPAVGHTALYDQNQQIRGAALSVLARIGRAEAIPTLRTIAETDENAKVRKNAERAIAAIEAQEARRAEKALQQRK